MNITYLNKNVVERYGKKVVDLQMVARVTCVSCGQLEIPKHYIYRMAEYGSGKIDFEYCLCKKCAKKKGV